MTGWNHNVYKYWDNFTNASIWDITVLVWAISVQIAGIGVCVLYETRFVKLAIIGNRIYISIESQFSPQL
jgi:hypothetical protein